jgi:hypothetical protein
MVKSEKLKFVSYTSIVLGWWRAGACTGCWWGNLRERDHWEDPRVDGRIIFNP